MRLLPLQIGAVALAFGGGMWVQSYRESRVTVQNPEPVSSAAQVQAESSEVEKEFPRLLDDAWLTPFNGEKLQALESSWADNSALDRASVIDNAEVQPIGHHDLLVSYGDALYRLNQKRDVVWEFRTAQFVIDFEVVASQNLIYLTAGDNVMAILHAGTGKDLYGNGRNGSAAYGVAKQYGQDSCLIKDNFRMYREKLRAAGGEPMRDGIACWRGTTELWNMEFPADAELVVKGKRIVAVTKSRDAIYVREMTPPRM